MAYGQFDVDESLLVRPDLTYNTLKKHYIIMKLLQTAYSR